LIERYALRFLAGSWLALAWPGFAALGANSSFSSAVASITEPELYRHVEILSDDIYEGRAAGSRGGHAAARYVTDQLQANGFTEGSDGGATEQRFEVQRFNDNCRNLLVLFPGDDPTNGPETIVVGAHYDHVGYGKPSNSFGPQGRIHNGADDNASGASVLLEVIQAFNTSGLKTRRSILFAFWDGEEDGLLGSRHWMSHPTLPLARVKLNVTIDMVGRLRDERLEVLGTRSGYGLRRLFSGPVEEPLWLDFAWDVRSNSDHWPFLERGIPAAILHTGIHSDYHRPTDDVEKINAAGMQKVARYLLGAVTQAANSDRLPKYRSTFRQETNAMRRALEQPLPVASLDAWPANEPRPRLGIAWREDEAEPGSVLLTRIVKGTPAALAGFALNDRLYELDDQPIADSAGLQSAINARLDNGNSMIKFLVERRGRLQTVTLNLPTGKEPPNSTDSRPAIPAR
jgi:hypothetical protein